jgi:hypothetical protein
MGLVKHGHSTSKNGRCTDTYRAWQHMLCRCYQPSTPGWDRYGGRGIAVCERWRHSFPDFLFDMGEKPSDKSLDRIDTDGDYSPGNCRWASTLTQSRNTSRNINLTIGTETKCLTDWCAHYGIRYNTVVLRIKRGRTPIEALTMQKRRKARYGNQYGYTFDRSSGCP